MMSNRNHNTDGERGGLTGSRYRDVQSPARTDGLGVALRNAFSPSGDADDFISLLQEIDRKTAQ